MSPLAELLDLVLPRRCVGCGSPLAALCPLCLPSADALWLASGPVATVAAAAYAGAVRAALIAYKERGRRDLVRPLSDLLTHGVRSLLDGGRAPPGRVVLVPVPSARAAAAARGGDHVARLGRRVAAATGLRLAPDVLRLVRGVRDSAGLRVAERAANLSEAMAARHAPVGWTALLVDDIVTTGATVREAGRALTASGWPVLGAAAVAATPRTHAGPACHASHWQGMGHRSSVG